MIRNYEKGGAIGTPSTFLINWRASYNVGDKVRIRIDMVDKNIDYNSDDNVFTIVKIEKGGATPFKLDSKGNSIGGFIRDENPSGFLYILDKNGGSWEGKDLETYLEVIQPQTTTTIVEKTKVSNNSNKEEIQLLVDNFITSNATEIQKISQDNPLLFDSVTNILSFISTKLGTREGAIEIPKFEEPTPLVVEKELVNNDILKLGLVYVKNFNVLSMESGFYELQTNKKNPLEFIFKNGNTSLKFDYYEVEKLKNNDDFILFDVLFFDKIYYFEFNRKKVWFKLEPTFELDTLRMQYGEEFIIHHIGGGTEYENYFFKYSKDFKVGFMRDISVDIDGQTAYIYKGNSSLPILEALQIRIKGGLVKEYIHPVPLSTNTTSTASTTTPQKTTKKAKKVLTQEEKDRIEEIKLEIEGLELIAEDDDDAKEEIQKLKNELKQIKNS